MAVAKMKLLSVIGRMPELDKVTVSLGESGIFHPDSALSFYPDTSKFFPVNDENPYAEPLHTLEGTMNSLGRRVELLDVSSVEKIAPSLGDWQAFVSNFALSIKDLLERRERLTQHIEEDRREKEKTGHFAGLGLNLDEMRECRFVKIRFGSLPKESYQKLAKYRENPYVVFFPASRNEERLWGLYCAPVGEIEEVDRVFAGLSFERIRLKDMSGTTETVLTRLQQKLSEESAALKETGRKIDALWAQKKETVQNVYSWLSERCAFFNIRRYAARYGDNFILTGWIPADSARETCGRLERFRSVKYTLDDGADSDVLKHSPPVRLKNRRLFKPFEYFVELYGLPSYDEIDPTALVALTYVLLFGVMFADLGQGLCILLAGLFMQKKFRMPLGRILVPCGISSSVFGFLFGSFFGFEHALDPVYRLLFGLRGKPISVMEPAMTGQIIYFAVGLGVLLVIVAICMNIYSSLHRKDYTSGLFGPNGAAGLVFYCAVAFGLGGQLLTGRNVFSAPYVVCLIVLPIAVFFFREVLGAFTAGRSDWKPESWGDYIMQNIFEVFEFLLSFLTNTMSFIRVGAFVLVHAGMMMVVFMLAEMTGGIWYVLIIAFGNVFVLALEGLLVGIQALRLEFYEMFSRFFDGGGRPFAPVAARRES